MKRALFMLPIVLVVFVAVGLADAPPDARERGDLRFEQADLQDLLARMKRQRAKTPGVWAQICLTREMVLTEIELDKINERLSDKPATPEKETKPAVKYEPPAKRKAARPDDSRKTKETKETSKEKRGRRRH